MGTWQKLTAGDVRLLLWLHGQSAKKPAAVLSRGLSHVGDGYLYASVGVLAWFADGEQGRAFFYAGILAYVFELGCYLLVKNTIRRERPHDLDGLSALITPSDEFSFPSGHTAAACVFATMLLFFYPFGAPLAYALAVLIGLSRVVLGVHYPSDILAGALLGVAAAGASLFCLGYC